MGNIVTPSEKDIKEAIDNFDWTAFDALTDEDIAEQIASNPDAAPDMSEALLAGEFITRTPNYNSQPILIRQDLKMTQEEFAKKFHLSLQRVQDWEQRKAPSETAQLLLKLIAK